VERLKDIISFAMQFWFFLSWTLPFKFQEVMQSGRLLAIAESQPLALVDTLTDVVLPGATPFYPC